MKKQIFKHIIVACIIFTTIIINNACSDVLDVAPQGKLTMEEIFSDEEKIGAFLNTCYDKRKSKERRYWLWSRGPIDWCDEGTDPWAYATPMGASNRIYKGECTAGKFWAFHNDAERNGNQWEDNWTGIRYCSEFLYWIENAPATINQDNIERWKAEAHVLRAYYYMELLHWFGTGLPFKVGPYGLMDDFSGLEKPGYYETVKYIIDDCDVALANDHLPWRITSAAENSRFTKAVASIIKSRMILYAASPLYNEGNNHWKEAYDINKAALADLRANGYELYNNVNYPAVFLGPNTHIVENDRYTGIYETLTPELRRYAALYNEYFAQHPNEMYSAVPLDKETIYQWHTTSGGASAFIHHLGQGSVISSCPTKETVDAFETIDGEPILDLANPYLDERHLQPNFNPNNTLYDDQDPYKNRDPRFYASIYFNGSYKYTNWPFAETAASPENFPGGAVPRKRHLGMYIGENRTGINNMSRNTTHTGYQSRKFQHPTAGRAAFTVVAPFWKFFRLGEVILNFAEAAAEHGELDEARDAVNEIRSRVGMPDLPEGLSKEQLILRIRNERRVELNWEDNRYFDVRRWTSPDGDLSKTDKWVTASYITRNGPGDFTWERRNIRGDIPRENYTNKYLKAPIPLDEANRLLQLTGKNWQNPGW